MQKVFTVFTVREKLVLKQTWRFIMVYIVLLCVTLTIHQKRLFTNLLWEAMPARTTGVLKRYQMAVRKYFCQNILAKVFPHCHLIAFQNPCSTCWHRFPQEICKQSLLMNC